MADKSLVMSFLNEQGKRVSLRVNSVKDDLTETQASQLMDTVIAKNIFETTGGDLKMKDSAQIVERNTSKLNVK